MTANDNLDMWTPSAVPGASTTRSRPFGERFPNLKCQHIFKCFFKYSGVIILHTLSLLSGGVIDAVKVWMLGTTHHPQLALDKWLI